MSTVLSSGATSASWPRALHQTGSTLFGLIGLGHLLAVHLLAPPLPEAEREVAALSARVTSPLVPGGLERTVLELNTGYSVGLGAVGLAFAMLAWFGVRHAPELALRRSGFTLVCLAAAGTMFALSVTSFPEPPIVLSAASTLCYLGALVTAGGPAGRPVR